MQREIYRFTIKNKILKHANAHEQNSKIEFNETSHHLYASAVEVNPITHDLGSCGTKSVTFELHPIFHELIICT